MKDNIFDDICDVLKKLDVYFTTYCEEMTQDEKEVFERVIRFFSKEMQENVAVMAERVEERIKYVRLRRQDA